ncbi:MAG: ATP-dependent helicase/nuclease subunit A [Tenericutes bacterium ADurb.Bin087]|nr:MAG: ATP-dependent helicase/nuclease subunit A [Tenericutes bacterium ADurb.Bin087]
MTKKANSNEIVYSPKQEEALSLTKENMLVSAGAGSGKTAVLVERIIRILTQKEIPLDRILVLTFTNAGAEEFKKRIKQSLLKSENHAHKAFAVDNADITTLDAYSLKILRRYGYMHPDMQTDITNLDVGFEMVLMKQYFDEIMMEYYNNPPLALKMFAKRFLSKDDDALFKLVQSLDRQVNLQLNPDTYLEHYIETFYSDSKFEEIAKELDKYVVNTLRKIANAIKHFTCERHLKVYETFLDHYGAVLSFEDYMNNLDKFAYQTRPRKTLDEHPEDTPYAEEVKILIADLKELLNFGTKDTMYDVFMENKGHAEFVVGIYKQIRDKLRAFKKAKAAYTFSDIARSAYELVSIPEVQQELKNQYDYILIDEYQDTSDIQEQLINKIANNNVYMVGDIKQSIYGFRNANCDIFREKYAKYQKNKGGRKVDLNDNYRSRPEVLSAINAILSDIMSDEFGGANYQKDHLINHGNLTYNNFKNPKQKVGLEVINYVVPKKNDDDDVIIREKLDYEVDYIINDIEQKIHEKYQVYDKKSGLRDVRYGDFTILIAEGTNFNRIEERFVRAGIPVYVDRDEKAKENNINIAINKLLTIFVAYTKKDEPQSYEFRLAVASFLRGFVNKYSDAELLNLLKDKNWDFSRDHIISKIKKYAKTIDQLPVMEIVNRLVSEFDIYGSLNHIRDLTQNTMKLSSKLAEIENLANLGLNLEAIVNYLNEREVAGIETELKRVKLERDAVTIMTIHRSKGLEFPIVYYMELDSNFYRANRRQPLKVCPKYGFVLPEPAYKTRRSFIGFLANIYTSKETLSEKIRLLYVALTRAKELMVIIHDIKESGEKFYTFDKVNTFKTLLLQSPYYDSVRKVVTIEEVSSTMSDIDVPLKYDDKYSLHKLNYAFKQSQVLITSDDKKEVDDKVLARGTLLHRYFEEYDFDKQNLDYISEAKDRKHIRDLLTLPFFRNVTNDNIFREYEFIDEDSGKTYAIDCFINYGHKIVIIDFKLSNIDDPLYDLQVSNYAKYLAKVFNLPVEGYLVSIIKLEYREVKING